MSPSVSVENYAATNILPLEVPLPLLSPMISPMEASGELSNDFSTYLSSSRSHPAFIHLSR